VHAKKMGEKTKRMGQQKGSGKDESEMYVGYGERRKTASEQI